jgi:hypothetical protein
MHGHEVRRWNYPPGYRVPVRMPESARRAIKAIENDDTTKSPVPALARELEARCRDFRRIDDLYKASEGGAHPAHTYWSEAYFGIIETADWLRIESTGPVFQWANRIFPGEMARHMRGVPTDAGLSKNFQGMLAVLEDRLARVARTSHNVTVPFEDLPNGDRMPELQDRMFLAAGQALKNLKEVFEWARDDLPLTPEDRLLKMRIIEIEYGPRLMIPLHARITMSLYRSRKNLTVLRDLRNQQRNRKTRAEPKRLDPKYWSWMYRKDPYAHLGRLERYII